MGTDPNLRVLADFLDYLRIEKGLAKLTVSAYSTDILQFAEFLEKRKRTLMTAQRGDVREFLQQLFSHQVDGRSVGRKLSALRHLYRYLLLDKRIEHDPTLNIESPKQWKVLPKSLARDEIEITLKAPGLALAGAKRDSKDAAAIALRDRAMLELLYAGALRVSELVGAGLEDLKLESGYMLVRGKGDKERIVPLGKARAGCSDGIFEEWAADAVWDKSRSPCLAKNARHGAPVDFSIHRTRWTKAYAAARVADGGRGFGGIGAACFSAHAAAFLRYPYGRERRGLEDCANNLGPLGYFDHAGVYASGDGSAADRLPEASSKGEGEVTNRPSTVVGKAVVDFLHHLRERNASPHTIKAYSGDLANFSAYAGSRGWRQIDHIAVRGFLSQLYEKGLGKTSVARSLAAVRSLYRWLAREGVVEQNPAKLVATPKLPKKLPRVPTIEEMNSVLDGKMPEVAAFPERDLLMLELLYGCGIRNSELTGINLDDIRLSAEAILIRGKGKKERYVPFGGSAKVALAAYLPARQVAWARLARTLPHCSSIGAADG